MPFPPVPATGYSNSPHPDVYAHIPSPLPNIDFPEPYWINALKNMALIGCTNPDLAYIELAIAAAAKLAWTVETPSTKQLIEKATGASWICSSKQVMNKVNFGNKIADSGAGRFIYGGLKGLDIQAYYAFMLSSGAQGVVNFASWAQLFKRRCTGLQDSHRGVQPLGGWPYDPAHPGGDNTGPTYLNNSGFPVSTGLTIPRGQVGVMVCWCNFAAFGASTGVVTRMYIQDDDTGNVLDESTVDNMFTDKTHAICQFFTTEGLAPRDLNISLRVQFLNSTSTRIVTNTGGCYVRAWHPGASDAPPYWNMRTMLKPREAN